MSHVHVSNKSMCVSVPEVRRDRRIGSSAVNVHGCSRQKVQISAGVCWGRESLPHHRQHCQPCVKRNLAGRQPNNPTRGHIFCYGSRSADFCIPEFGSKATEFLVVVLHNSLVLPLLTQPVGVEDQENTFSTAVKEI